MTFKNIRTCIVWTAATLCGGALAASHIVDIAWSPDGRFAHKAQIAAGKFVEVCGKLTLKHADIKSLDMPAMTMVFTVKDKAMLDKLKAGDKIKFKAINDAGKFTVTEMQMAP